MNITAKNRRILRSRVAGVAIIALGLLCLGHDLARPIGWYLGLNLPWSPDLSTISDPAIPLGLHR